MFYLLWKGVCIGACRNLGEVCVVIAREMEYGYKEEDFDYFVSSTI